MKCTLLIIFLQIVPSSITNAIHHIRYGSSNISNQITHCKKMYHGEENQLFLRLKKYEI